MKISEIPLEEEKKSSSKKRKSPNGAKDSTTTIGFEANAASVPATGKRRHA